MPESSESVRDIQAIRHRLEAIEATQLILVRNHADELWTRLDKLFSATPLLADVYLAVDGTRTQAELLDVLSATGLKTSQPTVSRRMETLRDHGLIDLVYSGKQGDVYEKNRLIEQILRLSRRLSA